MTSDDMCEDSENYGKYLANKVQIDQPHICSTCGDTQIIGPPITPGSNRSVRCPNLEYRWHIEAQADIKKQSKTLYLKYKSIVQNVLRKLPKSTQERKQLPIATGAIDYFPLAFGAVAELSKKANDQHNPGQPLHWARGKSTDHADCLMRHFIERGTMDTDGIRHTAKVAWRALAILQEELEAEAGWRPQ